MELDSVFDGLLESYMNDYYIFETVLRQDYYEVSGLLTEASIKNFLVSIWEKIVQAFNWIKNKINEIIDKYIKKKDEKESNFYNALISRFTILWGIDRKEGYKYLPNFEYAGFHKIKGVINANSKYVKDLDSMIKKLSFNNMDKKGMEMAIENLPKDMKEVFKGIHDSIWESETTDKPFEKDTENTVETMVNILKGKVSDARAMKILQKTIEKSISDKEKEAKKMLKKFEQDVKKNRNPGYKDLGGERDNTSNSSNNSSNSNTSSNSSSSNNSGKNNIKYITMKSESAYLLEDDENTVELSGDKAAVDKAQIYLKLIVATKSVLLATLKCVLHENINMGNEVYKVIRACNNWLARKYMFSDDLRGADYSFSGTDKERKQERKERRKNAREERKEKEKERKERRKRASKMESYIDDLDYLMAVSEAEIYESEL